MTLRPLSAIAALPALPAPQVALAAPRTEPDPSARRWTIAASALLHAAAIALILAVAARSGSPSGADAPAYDLVFESPQSEPAKPSGLPPMQPADIPVPDDAPLGPPAPAALAPPQPDGAIATEPQALPAAPPSAAPPAPQEAVAPPAVSPPLAFAPPPPAAETPPQTPPPPAQEAPPEVNLQVPPEQSPPAPELAPIMPEPPPPLPQSPARPRPAPPLRPRPAPRAPSGTLASPMDLNFGPAPRPAARGSVASRAIDLSLPPQRQSASRSDPYAAIRAANASADWNRGLLQYWLRHRFYPPQAAENGEQGSVTIQLTVQRSGRVTGVEVLSPSGSQWLDMAAVSTFRDAKLPPFTNEMPQDSITFPIPINYYLIRK